MKKIVVIMIVGLYIGSIFLVNFFGLQYVTHELNVYVTEIECKTITKVSTNKDTPGKYNESKGCLAFTVFLDEPEKYTMDNLKDNPNTFRINCTAYPENAANRNVSLLFDGAGEGTEFHIDNEEMTITFFESTGVTVTLKAADGSNVKTKIYIAAI